MGNAKGLQKNTKVRQFWRNKQIETKDLTKSDGSLEVTIPEKLLALHVEYLRNTALRVQIQENRLTCQEIQEWAKESWEGMK